MGKDIQNDPVMKLIPIIKLFGNSTVSLIIRLTLFFL